jgi:hypothetical protein
MKNKTLKEKLQNAREHQIKQIIEEINTYLETYTQYEQELINVKYYLNKTLYYFKKMETNPAFTTRLEQLANAYLKSCVEELEKTDYTENYISYIYNDICEILQKNNPK